MAGESARGNPDPKRISLSAVFSSNQVVSAERRAAVVSRVLSEFSSLPVGAKNTLRTAVNDEIVPTTGGFRRGQAGRALDRSAFVLQEQIVQTVTTSDLLAGAVLRCWAESHPSLREAVERHLTGRGLTTPGPNLSGKLFRGHWLKDQWEGEQESFVQTYNDDFDSGDIALMLCYVSGNFPPTPEASSNEAGEVTLNQALSSALLSLRELPATSQEWERQIPDFVASVSRLIEEKAAQLRWSEEFDAILLSVRETYADLLEFFEEDTHQWAAGRVSEEADSTSALKLASVLQSRLAEYRPIHDRAPSFSEERERTRLRDTLQPSILMTLQEIAALMTGEFAAPESSPITPMHPETLLAAPDTPRNATPADSSPDPARPLDSESPQAPPLQEAHTLVEPAQRKSPVVTVEAPAESAASTPPELKTLQSENHGLRDNAIALSSANQDLKDEVEALKTELFSSQEREDSWRLAYRSAMDGSLEEVGVAPPVVESVLDAVEIAKSRFRQELLFAANSESSIEDNPFTDPARVWEALQWLATTYYASRMGRLRVTDFDQSIKEACGWWYKSDQGETTVSRYKVSYTTRVNGKRYTLVEHIGKGTTFDARYTIRIAFDWDREKRQVVIGYIGRHQQTDQS